MKRFFLTLSILLVLAPQSWAAESGSVLTGKTLIDNDVVTVGDLFTKTGKDAGYVLAPAPKPGQKLVLTKNDLQRVSDAFKLGWSMGENTVVTLERNSTLISEDSIITALSGSDLKDKISAGAQFKLSNLVQDDVVIPGIQTPQLVIKDTSFDAQSEKFSAKMDISVNNVYQRTVMLEGLATIMVPVPVMKLGMTSNNVIAAGDITEINMPKTQLRSDMILNKDELVGMITKRGLQPNQLISQADVMPPMMVKRNDMISVIYRNGPIQLSTKARALNNAGRGEAVQLINPSSKKEFEAKVTGPQQAEVNLDS